MIFNYNKLVRDRIVQNIQRKGHNATYSILNDKQYFEELNKKLIEEVNEFIEASNEEENELKKEHCEEEMSDIMEVLETIIKQKGMSLERIQAIKEKKKQKAGSFNDRIYLISVEEKDKDIEQEER